jgi:CP family cyanate transporter-like MFS transporter
MSWDTTPINYARCGRLGIYKEDRDGVAVAAGITAAGVVLLAFNLRIATGEIPPVLPDLPIGDVGKSVLVTIPVLCFSLAAFAGPAVRAMLGEERALFVMATALLFGVAVRPVGPTWLLFAGTVLCGVAVAVMNVMMPGIVRRRFPRRVGEMTAAWTMALSIGAGLSAGLTVPIRTALGGSLPWALGLWAVPAAIALAVWLPQLRVSRPATQVGQIVIGLLNDRLAWLITLYFGLQSMVFYILLSWLPAIYRAKGTDPSTAGAVLGVVTAVGLVGNFAAPIVAGRLHDRRLVILATSGLTIAGLAGILVAPTQTALVWASLLGVGTGGAFSIALLLLASGNRDAASTARLSSMALGLGYLLAAPGPFVAGLVHAASGSWQLPLIMTIGLAAVQLIAGLGAARSEGDDESVPRRNQSSVT